MARYEFSDGKSSKFWEIELSGSSFTVKYGRIGTDGQEQTKSFTTAELARKEHDKLVAEKTKKGYKAVGGTAASPSNAATPPAKAAKSAVPALRKDFYVYNEATGFMMASKRMAGKGLDNGGKEWEKAIKNADIIPIELIQDDPFLIRVVVGGELESQEAEEWVGRLDWKLRVPDGNLIVCGGSEYIMEEFENEEDSYMADYVRHMKVPKGEYRATVYMYMSGINGRACMQAARGGDEPDPLGEWFRRSRLKEKFPAWLHNECVSDPAEDPGHEKEWKSAKKVEDPNKYYCDFLLHLVPLESGAKISLPELADYGWFSTPTQCRVPERIPLGLVARDPEGAPKEPDKSVIQTIDIVSRTEKFKRAPLKGGPVRVPVEHLERLFRLAWFCHVWSMPQIRVQLSKETDFADSTELESVVIKRDGNVVNVGFSGTGRQSMSIRQVAAAGQRLKNLPDGSVIELEIAYFNEDELKKDAPMGLHRYRGVVKSGELLIDEIFPAVDAEKLKAALALSAQCEGETIDCGSGGLADTVLAVLKKNLFFRDNPAVKSGSSGIAMKTPEPVMLNFVAEEVFKHQFKGVWRFFDMNAEEDEEEEEKEVGAGPKPAPRGELILETAQRKFFLSDAIKFAAEAAKPIAEAEKDLLPLGFKFVADITCSAMPYGVIRAYAQDGGDAWAALTVMPAGRGTFEFVSKFTKGASLTTTRNNIVFDELYRDVFRNVRPGGKVNDMWKEHQERATHLREYHGALMKLDTTPKGLAADVEASIVRQEKKTVPEWKTLLLSGDDGRKHYAAEAISIHPAAPKAIAEADSAMKSLGFEAIGDVVSSFFTGTVFRGYAKPGNVWAKFHLAVSNTVDGYWEFATVFENGACLVTTRAAMSKDEPKRKIYRILDGQSPPKKLLEQHEKRRDDLVKKHGAPVAIKPDLKSFAAEVEAALMRIMG